MGLKTAGHLSTLVLFHACMMYLDCVATVLVFAHLVSINFLLFHAMFCIVCSTDPVQLSSHVFRSDLVSSSSISSQLEANVIAVDDLTFETVKQRFVISHLF